VGQQSDFLFGSEQKVDCQSYRLEPQFGTLKLFWSLLGREKTCYEKESFYSETGFIIAQSDGRHRMDRCPDHCDLLGRSPDLAAADTSCIYCTVFISWNSGLT
jgi:hypothetical protein